MAPAVETYVATYSDPTDAKIVTDLLNGYAMDKFGNSAPLPDDILAKLVRRSPDFFIVAMGTPPRARCIGGKT